MSEWPGWLYVASVLIPLGAFVVEALFGRWLKRFNAYLATAAIGTSCVLSLVGLVLFLPHFGTTHAGAEAASHHAAEHQAASEHGAGHAEPYAWRGSVPWVVIGPMGVGPEMPGRADRGLPPLVIPLGIHIDGLAVIMFAMVSLVATLIHVYSMEYMRDDPRYPRFFTYLSLFCFSMLGLVASANVFMVFMFWELVGVCSYLLIGFWYEEKKNTDAANKAFIVNRVGDVGMLVGLGILWSVFGTFTIADLNRALADSSLRDEQHRLTRVVAGDELTLQLSETSLDGDEPTPRPVQIPYGLLVIAGLGIFAGCVGKSAQFPLHVWLPDAMAGPTPVSALIHAATMVAAGVYLVGRFYPLFTHEVLLYIAYTGGITLLIGATIALVQTDYKKVLAYSTVSQLGFMMLGLGVGGWAAGLFHLITHAFFKALLFLSAGSVYHSVHTYEMPVLGGLRSKMPRTALCMLIGTLAISGVPLLSGFYSKDAILASSLAFVREYPGQFLLFVVPAVGAVLTAFYMFRMWFLIFDGDPRGEAGQGHAEVHTAHSGVASGVDAEPGTADSGAAAHGADHSGHHNPVEHAHESPPTMTIPLLILAALSIVVGYPLSLLPLPGLGAEWTTPVLERAIESAEPLPALDVSETKWLALAASIVIAAVGIGAAAGFYSRWRIFDPASARRGLAPLYEFFTRKWYFDELYELVLVRPTLALGRSIRDFDLRVIDGVVNGMAWVTRRVSDLGGLFDRYVVDGAVHAVALVLGGLGLVVRSLQTGQVRAYLALLALAVIGLFVGMYAWVR